jgi:hypothetical protein
MVIAEQVTSLAMKSDRNKRTARIGRQFKPMVRSGQYLSCRASETDLMTGKHVFLKSQ